jgi:peptidoglycan-associated lipoprotein
MKRVLFVAFGCALIAGCGSTPTSQSPAKVDERSPGTPPAAAVEQPKVAPVTPERIDTSGLAALKDPKSILSKRSVFFDFDSYVVRDEFKPLVEAHAKFLVSNPTMKVLLQGNADDRGSREYNLALGQKRADAVKNMLTVLGAKDAQIESVSLGEEKPRCSESGESCWSQNRRGDLLYSGEY